METNKYKQIILIVLGIALVVGLSFLVFKPKDKVLAPTDNTSETPIENPTNNAGLFGDTLTFKLNNQITFSDGLNVALNKIEDSRCPEGVQCIWAGELSGTLALSGGKMTKNQEIRLGTMTNKSVTLDGYVFSIKNATATSISISVEYKKPPVQLGACYIGGCSSEICSDQPNAMSTCIYRKEFACYKTAKCERQKSNQCGWTETPELTACLSK